MTASHLRPGTQGSLTFHRSGLTGDPASIGRGEGSQPCSQAPAGPCITAPTIRSTRWERYALLPVAPGHDPTAGGVVVS